MTNNELQKHFPLGCLVEPKKGDKIERCFELGRVVAYSSPFLEVKVLITNHPMYEVGQVGGWYPYHFNIVSFDNTCGCHLSMTFE